MFKMRSIPNSPAAHNGDSMPALHDEALELRENLSELDSDAVGDIFDAGRALLD